MHPCPEKMPDLQKYYKRNSSHIHGLIHLYKKICIIKLTRLLGQVQKTLSLSFSLSLFLSLSLSHIVQTLQSSSYPESTQFSENVATEWSDIIPCKFNMQNDPQNVDPSNKSGGPVLSRWLGYDWVWLGMIGYDWEPGDVVLHNYEKYYPTCLFIMKEGEKQAKPQETTKSCSHIKDSLI